MKPKFFTLLSLLILVLSVMTGCVQQTPAQATSTTVSNPATSVPATSIPPTQTSLPTLAPSLTAGPTVYGGLPRNETFIVAQSNPNSEVWDAYNTFVDQLANSCTGFKTNIEEMPFQSYNGTLYPFLAQSWKYNSDGTQFTLSITTGANWNDGTLLNHG